jgi:alpha-L-fucosidase 2
MQSHDGTIRVFPALPSAASTARFMLLAAGGFLVSSELIQGKIPYIGIKSLYSNHAVVANPWDRAALQVRSVSDGQVVATGSTATIEFDTTAGATYVIEKTSDPCMGHEGSPVSGTPNKGPRTLGNRRLGLQRCRKAQDEIHVDLHDVCRGEVDPSATRPSCWPSRWTVRNPWMPETLLTAP